MHSRSVCTLGYVVQDFAARKLRAHTKQVAADELGICLELVARLRHLFQVTASRRSSIVKIILSKCLLFISWDADAPTKCNLFLSKCRVLGSRSCMLYLLQNCCTFLAECFRCR